MNEGKVKKADQERRYNGEKEETVNADKIFMCQ